MLYRVVRRHEGRNDRGTTSVEGLLAVAAAEPSVSTESAKVWEAVESPTEECASVAHELGWSLPDVPKDENNFEAIDVPVRLRTIHGAGWSARERATLFRALGRWSRYLPEEIAEDVGKSEGDVSRYLERLQRVSNADRLALDETQAAFLARPDTDGEADVGHGPEEWEGGPTTGVRKRGKGDEGEGEEEEEEDDNVDLGVWSDEEEGAYEGTDVLNMANARALGKRRLKVLVTEEDVGMEGAEGKEEEARNALLATLKIPGWSYDDDSRVEQYIARALRQFLAPLVSAAVRQASVNIGSAGVWRPAQAKVQAKVKGVHVREVLWRRGLLSETVTVVALDDRGTRSYIWFMSGGAPSPDLARVRPGRQRAVRRALLALAAAPFPGNTAARPLMVPAGVRAALDLALDAPRREEMAGGRAALGSHWGGGIEVQD